MATVVLTRSVSGNNIVSKLEYSSVEKAKEFMNDKLLNLSDKHSMSEEFYLSLVETIEKYGRFTYDNLTVKLIDNE